MKLNEIMNNLNDLEEAELRALNRAVISQMKAIRNRESALKRHTLREGDKVSWTGRSGYTEGTIVRVKRKKAICDVGHGRNWDVPLNMLTAI
jgi:hypothetical protein